MPVLADGQKLQMEQFPTLFRELLTSVLITFKGEQICVQDSGSEVVPQLIQEFISYLYNKEPFETPQMVDATLKGFECLPTRSTLPCTELPLTANIFSFQKVAVKIFSISPSEICDECTASHLGWFNAAC